ncbi:hypothetical protein M9458_058218 [Cirrhinus mrigala]|uniref:Uncharacterized protein n=1 Tax=Cirrhinus mrigala TaxID=683832 RepID=A0ABD0MCF4_CIRMR
MCGLKRIRPRLELRLKVCTLEIEAEKQVKLQLIELEAMKVTSGEVAQPSPVPLVNVASNNSAAAFDISKHIALVPHFKETEMDTYFSAFERIASALRWLKEVWPLLLHCKLIGKAQEVCSVLPLEERLQYESVKNAVLHTYELVPEAYSSVFEIIKKSAQQTFVEFAREKGILFDKWLTANKFVLTHKSVHQFGLHRTRTRVKTSPPPSKELREWNTGASQSFVISDVIPLSEQTSCDSNVLRSSFLDKGVDFILGNDLAGGKVTPVVEVVDEPDCFVGADDIADEYPDVFVANVVTRAQAQRIGNDITLNDSFILPLSAEESVVPEPQVVNDKKSGMVLQNAEILTVPVTRKVMIAAQRSLLGKLLFRS